MVEPSAVRELFNIAIARNVANIDIVVDGSTATVIGKVGGEGEGYHLVNHTPESARQLMTELSHRAVQPLPTRPLQLTHEYDGPLGSLYGVVRTFFVTEYTVCETMSIEVRPR